MDSTEIDKFPCPLCGDRSFAWGTLRAHGVVLIPDDAPAWRKFFRFGTGFPARRCGSCENVQLFAKTRRDSG